MSIIKFQEKILKGLTFFKRIFYNSVVSERTDAILGIR